MAALKKKHKKAAAPCGGAATLVIEGGEVKTVKAEPLRPEAVAHLRAIQKNFRKSGA